MAADRLANGEGKACGAGMMLIPPYRRQPTGGLLGLSIEGEDAVADSPVRIVVMEGDGIGPEITAATLVVLRAADRAYGLSLSFSDSERRLCGVAHARHDLPG